MKRSAMTIGAAVLALGTAPQVHAQDAAETAAILSGTSGQAGAQRQMGANISRSINSAANAVAPQRTRPRARHSGGSSGGVTVGHPLPTGDPLEGSDATTYKLGNGSGITTTGRINTAPGTVCVKDCPEN